MKITRSDSMRTNTNAVKPKTTQYVSVIRTAFGECGVTGARPPFPAAATPAVASATSRTRTKDGSLRRTRWAFYEGVRALADRTAGARATRFRGLPGRGPTGAGTRLRSGRTLARLPEGARPGGPARLLALGLDVARHRRHLPQARNRRHRLRVERKARGRDGPGAAADMRRASQPDAAASSRCGL